VDWLTGLGDQVINWILEIDWTTPAIAAVLAIATLLGGIVALLTLVSSAARRIFSWPVRKVSSWRKKRQRRVVFDLVDDHLSHVSYLTISPPIDLKENVGLSSRVLSEPFRIAPPRQTEQMEQILAEAVKKFDHIEPGHEEYDARIEWYESRFEEGDFAKVDEFNLDHGEPREFDVFRRLIDHPAFEEAKKRVLIDYLGRDNGFHFNGRFLAVSKLRISRDSKEQPQIVIELRETDYYTFSIMYKLGQHVIYEQCGLDSKVTTGPHFAEYTVTDFQKNIHTSLGLAIIVHTLEDDHIIITRRSAHSANQAGEAGKYFMSVNEGINKNDIDSDHPKELKPLSDIVERALREELLGGESGRALISKIESFSLTGMWLYLPNMSIDLCLYVVLNCHSKDVRNSYPRARDGEFETSEIINDLPKCTISDIYQFVERSLKGKNELSEVWDEGALVTLVLSSLAISR
jgi:hypothetical protein